MFGGFARSVDSGTVFCLFVYIIIIINIIAVLNSSFSVRSILFKNNFTNYLFYYSLKPK